MNIDEPVYTSSGMSQQGSWIYVYLGDSTCPCVVKDVELNPFRFRKPNSEVNALSTRLYRRKDKN